MDLLTSVVAPLIRLTLPPGTSSPDAGGRRCPQSRPLPPSPAREERERKRERGDTGFSKFLEANKKQIKLCPRISVVFVLVIIKLIA